VDPVTVIVAALGAGVSAGLTDTAGVAVRDAYEGLRDAVRRRLGGGADGAIEAYAGDPGGQSERLTRLLSAAGAGQDAQIVAAARRLLELADPAGKYDVDLREAKGVVVGDGNVQVNHF